MIIEEIDGKKRIILEKNESIALSTGDEELGEVVVNCESDKLNISGSSLAIGEIRGNGMLEKVYIPPVLSSEELLERCDEWLKMFDEELRQFLSFFLMRGYKKTSEVALEVSFNRFHSNVDSSKGRTISINLMSSDSVLQKGASIWVDEENRTLYKYLLASVASNYLSVCYHATDKVDIGPSWDKRLHESLGYFLTMNLGELLQESDYSGIIYRIIRCYNLGIPTDQIIDNLRMNITPQTLLTSNLDDSIERSRRCHAYIMPKTDKSLDMQKAGSGGK